MDEETGQALAIATISNLVVMGIILFYFLLKRHVQRNAFTIFLIILLLIAMIANFIFASIWSSYPVVMIFLMAVSLGVGLTVAFNKDINHLFRRSSGEISTPSLLGEEPALDKRI